MSSSLITLLKDRKLRDTQPRRMVLDALTKIGKPASPYDIQKRIQSDGSTINAVTVYRILDVFQSLGIVHKHPCSGLFALCSMPEKAGHHGFLHCSKCDGIEEFVNDDLCRLENGIAEHAGFKPKSHVSEIVGVCRECGR